MSADWFMILREIDSLQKSLLNLQNQMKGENDRLKKLEIRKSENLTELDLLQLDLIKHQDMMFQIDKDIAFKTLQKQRLWEMGGDEEKSTKLSQEITSLEDQGFELLDQIEKIKIDLHDKKTFAQGIEKTIQEIQAEASDDLKIIYQERNQTQMRLDLLTNDLPSNFKDIFLRVKAKNLTHGPFTKNDQGSCYFCRFKISKVDESEIDIAKNLKTCPQCSRIFLPYGI